jgi:CheY-like chemotaxis protein
MPRLLLMEDTDRVLDLEHSFVQRRGFELVRARDEEDLLARAIDPGADLILATASLPGMTRSEFSRRLSEHPESRSTPIVFLAGPDSPAEAPEGEAGSRPTVARCGISRALGAIRPYFPIVERGAERADATLKVVCDDGSIQMVAFTQDISTSGLFLKGLDSVEPGARVHLHFALPLAAERGGAKISVDAEVVRRVKPGTAERPTGGIAVRFVEFPMERRVPLARFVRERTSS